jgi:hypothetical protein
MASRLESPRLLRVHDLSPSCETESESTAVRMRLPSCGSRIRAVGCPKRSEPVH